MNRLFIICLLGFAFLSVTAFGQNKPDTACANAKTQLDIQKCLGNEYVKSDKELNMIYQKILSKLTRDKSTDIIKALKESQRSWIIFRDNSTKVYEELYKGGSMMPVVVLQNDIKTIRNRIIELNSLYEDLDR